MKTETIVLNEERDVTLTTYIQPVGGRFDYIEKRPAIIILPGGGYQYLSAREAEPVAYPYLNAGYHVFILRYSIGKHATWPNPLNDFDEAISLIRSKADEWNVYEDKIAVIGFSAGGHLASAAATMAKNRPNAALLGYAVTGEDVKGCNSTAPDTSKYVDRNTCPCFIFATRTDALVPIENSVNFMSALTKAKIAYESHIYAYGPHGFSTCNTAVLNPSTIISDRVPHWVDDSIGWLKDVFGDFSNNGLTKPVCPRYSTFDYDEYLSLECTIAHLFKYYGTSKQLDEVLDEIRKSGGDTSAVGKMTLGALLGFARYDKNKIEELSNELKSIKNTL
ncbi:MAG: alpha/beta hydrolase [Erysipelotrichales bacterium]|nr:alpha/beta hydrolase [Erysipelotrichales bacterium]